MRQRCLIFTYGLLQPGHLGCPPSATTLGPDRVRGRLYDLGPFPAGVDLGRGDDWIEGVTLEIDADDLPGLDDFEDTESGEFCRVIVETERGHTAWAYEYRFPIPTTLAPRTRWR